MRQLVRQRQGLVEADQGLRRVPQQPEGHRGIDSAGDTQIMDHGEYQRTVLVWPGAGDACFQVPTGGRQGTKPQPRTPQGIVGEDREGGVLGRVAPGPTTSPRAHGRSATAAGQYKTATDRTGPGPARASRPSADTTRGPGCRCARPQARRALLVISSAAPRARCSVKACWVRSGVSGRWGTRASACCSVVAASR